MFKKLKLQTKLTLFVILVLILSNIAVALVGILVLQDKIHAEKQAQAKELVRTGLGIITHYHAEAEKGNLKTGEAREMAKTAIRAMLFGDRRLDYLWINDMDHIMLAHPLRRDLEGKDTTNLRDPDGMFFMQEFTKIARTQGSGYVTYRWQYYTDTNKIVPKLSYIELFKPWGWIVGTGVYVHEIREMMVATLQQIALIVLGMLLFVILVAVLVTRRLMIRPLNAMLDRVRDIAEGEGDLTKRVDVTSADELGDLAGWINRFVENLQQDINRLGQSTGGVFTAAGTLSASSQNLSAGTEQISQQAQTIAAAADEMNQNQQVLSSSIEEMSISVAEVAKRAAEAAQSTGEANNAADRTEKIAAELATSAQAISKVTDLIGNIAGQVNLLALNAAIEAASAGEAGRGFAVVAAEVKELAEQTTRSSEDIKEKVEAMQVATTEAVQAIKLIRQMIERIDQISTAIASSVEEQSITAREIAGNLGQTAVASGEVAKNVSGVAEAARDGAKSAGEVAASSRELETLAAELKAIAGKFKV